MARRRRRCRSLAITSFPDMTSQINAESLAALEIIKFPGKIVTVNTENEAYAAAENLMNETVVGIDTETRPSFRKGIMHNVALVQISTWDTCYLFRICRINNIHAIKQILESTGILKIGLSLKDDFTGLRRLSDNPASLHRTATICDGIRYRRNELTKNLCTSFREKNFKNTTTIQLGSPGVDKRPTALCGNRCMGLPPYLQSPQRRTSSRRISENIPDSPTERKRQTFYPEITSS